MNTKIAFFALAFFVFSFGFATANQLSDVSSIMTISGNSIVGGDSFLANFSFNYPPTSDNYNGSALIVKLNVTSSDQINYPVWKNDFQINGYADKCSWGIFGRCFIHKQVPFSCAESNQSNQVLIVNNLWGNNTEKDVVDGTFYCFNESNYLELNEGDNVFLNITPNVALWPGNYTMTAKMFYLNDTLAPFVNITNKNDFEKYYKPGNYLKVTANITENIGLSNYYGTILDGNKEYSIPFWKKESGLYVFTETSIPNNLAEGNYPIVITALDNSDNPGNDTTLLKLDETGPTISVISPSNNSRVPEIFTLELNVTDGKSGVNKESVYYELAEVINGAVCPDIGVGLNATCPNTHWINLPYDSETQTYKTQVNTTVLNLSDGSYWLYAKALDNLGNSGVLK